MTRGTFKISAVVAGVLSILGGGCGQSGGSGGGFGGSASGGASSSAAGGNATGGAPPGTGGATTGTGGGPSGTGGGPFDAGGDSSGTGGGSSGGAGPAGGAGTGGRGTGGSAATGGQAGRGAGGAATTGGTTGAGGQGGARPQRSISFGTLLDAQAVMAAAQQLAKSAANPSSSQWQAKGDQHRSYRFAAANTNEPYRLYVPTSWDGKSSLPLAMFLHGAGADENTYVDQNNKQMLLKQNGFTSQYKEVNADHPGMVPLVLPDVFDFFDASRTK